MRANVGFESEWFLGNGGTIDGLIGQSYQGAQKTTPSRRARASNDNISDVCGAADLYADQLARLRLPDAAEPYEPAGPVYGHLRLGRRAAALRVSAGYLYSAVDPYFYYDGSPPPASYYVPRSEATFGLSTVYKQWNFNTLVPAEHSDRAVRQH